MMKKSVTAFTLGMISSFICLAWGVIAAITGDILAATNVARSVTKLIAVFGWVCLFGSIVGLAGSALCLKNSIVGALCLTISSAMCGTLLVYLTVEAVMGHLAFASIIVLLLLSLAVMIIATIFGFLARSVEKPHYANDVKDDYKGPDASKNMYHYNRDKFNQEENKENENKDE